MHHGIDDQQLAVAGVYAEALLGLAEQRGLAEQVEEELEAISGLLKRELGMAAYLSNPTVAIERRREMIEHAFRERAHDFVVNTLQVMNRRSRLELVHALAAAYGDALDERRGCENVEVQTAVPLSEALRMRLQGALEKHTGRTVRLSEAVDESLVGGLVIRIGDEKIDTSVARALSLLTERLAERASQEVQQPGVYVQDSQAAE